MGIVGNGNVTHPSLQEKGSFVLGLPRPNPSSHDIAFSLELPFQTVVEADIYSLTGERIKTLLVTTLLAGIHNLVWDRRDQKGTKVGAGTYFIRVRVGKKEAIRKVTILK